MRAAGVACLATALVSVSGAGCLTRVTDMNETAPYREQIGALYELVSDCYVVTLRDVDELCLVNGRSQVRLPLPVDARHIGESTRDVNIKGVLPRGTRLRVAAIWERGSFDAGHRVEYFLELAEPGVRLRMNAWFLEDHDRSVFRLSEHAFRRR